VTNIDEELLKELQEERETLAYKSNSNILFDIKSKKFVSADSTTITSNLSVNKRVKVEPSLTLTNNEFIREGVFNFQKNHPGCLRATFTELGDKIEIDCYSTFFKGQLLDVELNRIIQFPKLDLDENPEKISQWDALKTPTKLITPIKERFEVKFVTETQKYFWVNCEPSGFIICGINAAEKTLIFSTSDIKSRFIGNILKIKRPTVSLICNIWPEFKPYLEISDHGLHLSLNKIIPYLPPIDEKHIVDGVYRITKHHQNNSIHAFLTHVNCC
jgi:hypothetical protein